MLSSYKLFDAENSRGNLIVPNLALTGYGRERLSSFSLPLWVKCLQAILETRYLSLVTSAIFTLESHSLREAVLKTNISHVNLRVRLWPISVLCRP